MNREGGRNTYILRRIVALLFALAATAERAAGASWPVRRTICWVLTLAFCAAGRLVIDTADELGRGPGFSEIQAPVEGDTPDDLIHLAYGFTVLAQTLAALVSHIDELPDARHHLSLHNAAQHIAPGLGQMDVAFRTPSHGAVIFHDTS